MSADGDKECSISSSVVVRPNEEWTTRQALESDKVRPMLQKIYPNTDCSHRIRSNTSYCCTTPDLFRGIIARAAKIGVR